jgi:pimeloyl-ACP methyl ester carboxylesterase
MGTNGMMSYWPWQLMEKLVSTGFSVTEFDNQGIGYSSDTPQAALTVQGMARNDIGLIRALGLKRPTVIGWSMGGEIALSMAALFGNAIGTVISSGGDVGSSHYVKGSAKNLDVFFHGSLPQVAALVFSPPSQRSQGALLSWADSIALFPAQVPTAQIEARQKASFTRLQHSNQVWDLLPTVRNKVIVTNGAEDVLNPPANARVIAARIPRATALLFPNAGHAMMFQDLGRFVSTVQRYASR